jgi:hypothetical protein
MTPGKQPEEFLDRVDRTAPKKSGPLKLIACVLLVLAVIGGFIFAGRYYYLAYYNPRDSAGAKHPAPPKRAEVSPGQDFASGESRSLEKRGLLWTPADANGYSFLAPSDPTRVFSSPPSLSARASRGADLRAEPNEGSEAVNRLNSGESVEIAQRHLSPGGKSTWYRVVGNSELDGWIRGGDIEFIY